MKRLQWVKRTWLPMPVLIVVVPTLPGRLLGLSMGPIVVLEDSVAQDLGTLEHELVHTKQFWRNGLVLHFLRYWMSRNYRLAMELEAFRAELNLQEAGVYAERLESAAQSLSICYGLGIELATARAALQRTE